MKLPSLMLIRVRLPPAGLVCTVNVAGLVSGYTFIVEPSELIGSKVAHVVTRFPRTIGVERD